MTPHEGSRRRCSARSPRPPGRFRRPGRLAIRWSPGLGGFGCVFLLHTRLQSRWLAMLGVYSYSIFLFHSAFSAASRIVLSRLFEPPLELLLASGVLAGLALPIAVELTLRRIGHPLGFRLLGQKPVRARSRTVFKHPSAAMPL